ncbi:MAG: 2-hydroxyglutaryl-CoA dehydratase, partial [Deltaproteobacteria bacterium]|nr:2-hydroxyglutaryl-CoA dehydratase [Deltaproteobacteria bacterium]
TVFAESEIISLLARGTELAPILRGVHRSLVRRIAAMARSIGVQGDLFLSGGVSGNRAVQRMLAEELGAGAVTVPPHAQLMGAYGAALLALG